MQQVHTCQFHEIPVALPDTSTQGITDALWQHFAQHEFTAAARRTAVALGWRSEGVLKVYVTDAEDVTPGDVYQMVTQFAPEDFDFYAFFGLGRAVTAFPHADTENDAAAPPELYDDPGQLFAFVLLVEEEGEKVSPTGAPVHVLHEGHMELGPAAPLPVSAFANLQFCTAPQTPPARTLH